MIKDLSMGLFKENPVFIIMLGLCPALAISTQVINGLGMGTAVIFVLVCSNLVISLLRNAIPESIKIPVYLVIIGVFVTIVKMLMHTFTPGIYQNLGIFTDLIVVNCIILGRAQAFAGKNTIGRSVLDALGMGLGFALSLILISLIREAIGSGSITLFPVQSIDFSGKIVIPLISDAPAKVMVYSSGALILMGFLKALFSWIGQKTGQKNGKKQNDEPSMDEDFGKKIEISGEPTELKKGEV
jgi:electron transport complex protein RnfE